MCISEVSVNSPRGIRGVSVDEEEEEGCGGTLLRTETAPKPRYSEGCFFLKDLDSVHIGATRRIRLIDATTAMRVGARISLTTLDFVNSVYTYSAGS